MTSTASGDACHADLGLAAVPCPPEVLTQLHKVSVATLFQVLHRLGFQRTYLLGVSPRTAAQRFVGRAFTMRCLPAREDVMRTQTPATSLHRRAFETINAGQVLVIDARGDLSAGVLGDVLATRLVAVVVSPWSRMAPCVTWQRYRKWGCRCLRAACIPPALARPISSRT